MNPRDLRRLRAAPRPFVLLLTLATGLALGPPLLSAQATHAPTGQAEASTVQATSQVPDSARLMAALAFLASDALEGRATGSQGNAAARDFLRGALEEAGLDTLPGGWETPFEFQRRDTAARGVNVLGWIRGTVRPNQYVVVTAHYDHVGVRRGQIYNGTDDNASGAAALVEVAHALVASRPRHSVIIVALDAEEMGLRGARAFVADPPVPLDAISLNVNLDMVGRGDGILWAGGAYHTPALSPILDQVAAEAPVDLRQGHDRPNAPEGADWTGQSDHGAFHAAGIPFVYFGVDDHPDYHRPTDDFHTIDPANYLANVRTILLGIRALDAALPLPQS